MNAPSFPNSHPTTDGKNGETESDMGGVEIDKKRVGRMTWQTFLYCVLHRVGELKVKV